MDYLSAHMNNEALSLCVEKALEIEIPQRAKIIRTILAELSRIGSHQLWWAAFGMDMGALTTFFYGMRDREMILDIFEETCGSRLLHSYICPGGLIVITSYSIHYTKLYEAIEVIEGRAISKITDEAERLAYLQKKTAEYNEAFANPYNAASFGYIDDVIEPRNTRFRVIRAFQNLQTKKVVNPPKKHSNIPL